MKWLMRAKRREKRRNDKYRELMAQADEIICRKKLYLDRNFTKEDLAVQLGTWCDYINSFRLKCFMEEVCLKDTRHVRVSELAERCGFGSYHSLNDSIKKKYGITAAAYKKNLSTSLRAEGRANTATLS